MRLNSTLPHWRRLQCWEAWTTADPTPEQRATRGYAPPPWEDSWWEPAPAAYVPPSLSLIRA